MKPVCIIDPGHGMGNRKAGRYDSGAVSNGVTEAEIVMQWANELRDILRARKIPVIRTRVDAKDPCSILARARIAKDYNGTIMVSLHCNAHNGTVSGTETFYRGDSNKAFAMRLNQAVVTALGTKSRGVKTEAQSQHSTLAVMSFQPCFLIEIGFIDHTSDRAKMLDAGLRQKACEMLADAILYES
jgi:N-acetylmuramoyl-L-alanine amidase